MILSSLLKVGSWFVGGKNPIEALTDTYLKYKDSEVASERIKADIALKQIDVELDVQKTAREVRLATHGHWEMRLATFLIVIPFIVHLYMVFMDTIGDFTWNVSAFPEPFSQWGGVILLSFFGLVGIDKYLTAKVVRK